MHVKCASRATVHVLLGALGLRRAFSLFNLTRRTHWKPVGCIGGLDPHDSPIHLWACQ